MILKMMRAKMNASSRSAQVLTRARSRISGHLGGGSVKVAIDVTIEQMIGMMDSEEAVERREAERKEAKFLPTIEGLYGC